ncbi:MAG: PTS sugar transporter subunit IIB [Spirochaetaceae bacterium]|jgi:mannose/fructose/N-acetylgalactosamine-specific phosphotransferase system component IIB|nr:PTS sugar transporter subunit IIB [Spirochaetaceae bacterium]
MVKLLRVDERLLHGQVALNWVSNVGASSILIANDDVMQNEMSKMALKVAKPSGVNLAIRDIKGAADLLNDPRSADITVFVIVRTLKDALSLARQTDAIKFVNIGGIKKKEGSRLIAPAVFVNNDDMEILKQLSTIVDKIEFRMLPSDSSKSWDSIL